MTNVIDLADNLRRDVAEAEKALADNMTQEAFDKYVDVKTRLEDVEIARDRGSLQSRYLLALRVIDEAKKLNFHDYAVEIRFGYPPCIERQKLVQALLAFEPHGKVDLIRTLSNIDD